jgi:glycosyltransferase involved in cell wall biosynthesis
MKIVSIVTPIRDNVAYFEELAKSIISQTYPYWEWIVVDDHSDARNAAAIKQVCEFDSRIKYIANSTDRKGANCARNIGMKLASGAFVMFIDSDDLMKPRCLEIRVKETEGSTDYDGLIFPQSFWDNVEKCEYGEWIPDRENDDYINQFLLHPSPWPVSGGMWKLASLNTIRWNEYLTSWQDWDFHMKCLLKGLVVRYVAVNHDVMIRRNCISTMGSSYMSRSKIARRIIYMSSFAKDNLNVEQRRIMVKNIFAEIIKYHDNHGWINTERIKKSLSICDVALRERVLALMYLMYRYLIVRCVSINNKFGKYYMPWLPKTFYSRNTTGFSSGKVVR